MDIKLFIVLLVSVISENESANILAVFPMPSISHQVVFRKITVELANRGHDVTVITPDPAYPKGGAPNNYKEIDVHDISYGIIRQTVPIQAGVGPEDVTGKPFTIKEMRLTNLFMGMLMTAQFKSKEVQEFIAKKKKFDLIIIESVVRSALLYSHIFKAPLILVSSFAAAFSNSEVVGSPTHPLLYPKPFRHRLYNLSFREKLTELYRYCSTEYADYLNEEDENKLMKDLYGPQCPSIHELSNNVDMLFLNIYPMWADNQPVAPNVIYMGGIHQLQAKELPEDLKSYLDSSKNGVIYVSFGTNALSNTIPVEKIHVMINVLSKLPFNILWKWDKDQLPRTTSNIKTSKWLPQSDLLRHPNIKLFITQAGLQSTDEAITAGVPMVAIPMIGDQWYNAEKYDKFGIGIKLEFSTLTEDNLQEAIQNILENDSYRSNIIKLRRLMRDQPESPLNRTMWWIEYVLRHQGAKHLRSPAANMSYSEYIEVEVLLFVLSVFIIILIAIALVLKTLVTIITKLLKGKKLKRH